MTKDEFIAQLTHRLGYLPYEEVKRSVDFYREAIDDRMEDGLSEYDAVAAMGSIDDIVSEIAQTMPLSVIVKERFKDEKKRAQERGATENKGLWIALIILGAPLWIPLLATVFALVIAGVVTVFALLLCFFAVAAAVILSGAAVVAGAFAVPILSTAARLMFIGAGLAVVGVGVICMPLANLLSRVLIKGLKAVIAQIKRLILKERWRQNA